MAKKNELGDMPKFRSGVQNLLGLQGGKKIVVEVVKFSRGRWGKL
jgi:hypothetical protein